MSVTSPLSSLVIYKCTVILFIGKHIKRHQLGYEPHSRHGVTYSAIVDSIIVAEYSPPELHFYNPATMDEIKTNTPAELGFTENGSIYAVQTSADGSLLHVAVGNGYEGVKSLRAYKVLRTITHSYHSYLLSRKQYIHGHFIF